MLTFPSAPTNVRHLPQGLGEQAKVNLLLRRENSTPPLWPSSPTRLIDFFFKSPKSSAHVSGAWCHSHPAVTFQSGVSIVTSPNDTSASRARGHLCSRLHPTNPCAKRKALSLTKPKGKTQKTKSLHHYITNWNGFSLPFLRFQFKMCPPLIGSVYQNNLSPVSQMILYLAVGRN